MRARRLMWFVAVLLVVAPLWGKFGVVKTHARFVMYHPPAFHAFAREVRVRVDSTGLHAGFLLAPRLERQLQDALTQQNFKVTPDARTFLEGTLTDSTVIIDSVSRTESVSVHVGEHTEQKAGKSVQVEDCKTQDTNVTYLVSAGHLALELRARDTKTDTLAMNHLIERQYRQESAIAGPQKCNGGTYGVQRGQLQDPISILAMLSDGAVGDVVTLAVGYDEPRDVLLAVDDELKPGNAQAVAGVWSDALDTWTNATARARSTEAARHYNIGTAHEALAAAAMRDWKMDDASSQLYQAQESFSEALKLDPKEKYFRDTMARLEFDRGLLQQELDQASQEQEATGGQAPRRPASSADAPPDVPAEEWPAGESAAVHDYRVYVRTRLRALKERPTDALRQELLSSAGDYGVEPDAAVRVLDSESQRLTALRRNMEKYREDFQAAAADGVITPDDRVMLRRRQQILHLTDAQVKEIEGQFKFQETAQSGG